MLDFFFHKTSCYILKICLDYGGKFMNTTFQENLAKHKIHHNIIANHTHSRRMVLLNKIAQLLKWCSMLHAFKVDISFWYKQV
jgi:hypothetical protein